MLNLTREQAIEEHRKMWNWIADETERRQKIITKDDYFKEYGELEIPLFMCYCCEYANPNPCEKRCPVIWLDNEKSKCISLGSPFVLWLHQKDYKKSAEYARQIANLPEREN